MSEIHQPQILILNTRVSVHHSAKHPYSHLHSLISFPYEFHPIPIPTFILFHPHFHLCVQIQLHLSSSNAISISVSFQGIQFSEKIEISNSYIMFVFHDFHISAEINFCDQVDCNMLSWVKLTLCYEITLAPSFTWSKIWFCIYLDSVRLLVSLQEGTILNMQLQLHEKKKIYAFYQNKQEIIKVHEN